MMVVTTINEGTTGKDLEFQLPKVSSKANKDAIVLTVPLSKGKVIVNKRGYKNKFFAASGFNGEVLPSVKIDGKVVYCKLSIWVQDGDRTTQAVNSSFE